MKPLALTVLAGLAFAMAGAAMAQDNSKPPPKNAGTAGGAAAGVVAGAAVAGPIGAVVGGVAGATIGHKTVDKSSAHHVRHRTHRTRTTPATTSAPPQG